MAITDWPRNERPREKLLLRGSAALSDAELLAIFLRTGVRGKTAVDLARELLVNFGSLRAMLTADFDQFTQHLGLGPAKFAQLQAVLEMSRRHLSAPLPQRHMLNNPQATQEFLQVQLRDYSHEVFAGLFLDTRHRVICFKELFHGTLSSASVYPREVIKTALKYNAAAVIFAHNHPSGIADPSIADQQITTRLKDALALVDIQVLDHIVVGDNSSVSFAERGLI